MRLMRVLWIASMIASARSFGLKTKHFGINFMTRLSSSMSEAGMDITQIMGSEADDEMMKLVEYYENVAHAPSLFSSREEAFSFVRESVDTVMFDCDGVVYRNPDEAPGARGCIQSLMDQGKKVLFVTNNASSNRIQLRDKLTKILKLDGLSTEQMITSSFSCAQYLKHNMETPNEKVFVIGSQGLCDEIQSIGLQVVGGPSTDKPSMSREELADYPLNEHPVDAVVVGHDTEFNFRKMCIANVLLEKNPNAKLIATNRDSFDLVGSDARKIPGNGCQVQAIECCSQREAVNVGKLSRVLAKLIESQHGLEASRTMIVGDRLDTDIRFGVDSGMISALVLTGVTKSTTMINLGKGTHEEPLPTVIFPYIGFIA